MTRLSHPAPLSFHPRAGLAFVFVFALLAPSVGFAQDPTASDLRALRFYNEQGNDEAAQAELRRLRAAFPNWTPPEEVEMLFTSGVPVEVERIYALIASGDHAAARALIAATDAANEDWTPPADMLTLLSLSEAQQDFDAFVGAGDREGVIRIARGIPALLSCERINNAWELAEAYLSRGDTVDALRVYRAVIDTCSDPDSLVATLEKANVIATLDTLAEMSDRAQDQAPAAVQTIRRTEDRLRIGRGAEARWQNGESLIAVPDVPTDPAAELRPRPRPQREEALAPARAPAPTAPAAAASSSSGGLSAVQRAAQAGDWTRCLALSATSTHPAVIYQRGWCAYNLDRPHEAITAFEFSIRRLGAGDQRRDAGYGLLLSMLSLNMTEQAAQFAATAPLTRQQRINIEAQILDQRGLAAYENGEYARAVAFFRAYAQLVGSTRRDLLLLEGYALLNMGDRTGARAIFERLHRDLATPETRQALRAAN